MGKWLSAAIITAFIIVAWPLKWAQAQTPNALAANAVTIELWPEYDQPAMLVIMRVTLEPTFTLPASVTLHIPARSNGPFAVAVQDANGSLLNTQFVTTPQGDLTAVTLQATQQSFQVEYYDPALTMTGENRKFDFEWTADFPVAAATLRVQEPLGARNLAGQPALALAGTSEQGWSYYTASLGALTAGQNVRAQLTYAKADSVLSVTWLTPAAPAAPLLATSNAAPSGVNTDAWPWVLGGALTALVVLGGVWWWRTRLPATPKPRRRRAASQAEGGARFCTQCGERVNASNRFCPQCGAVLRAETSE